MKVINAYWEKKNLGLDAVELTVEGGDLFDLKYIEDCMGNCDYLVVKVPMNMSEFNIGLSNLGFSLIETQFAISKKYADFDFSDRLTRAFYPHADMRIIETSEELESTLDRFTPNMFSTDRIYLDPYFPREASMIRYKNWIRTEFEGKTARVEHILYDGKVVGFVCSRECNGVIHGLLGGIFEDCKFAGLGVLTISSIFLSAHKNGKPFKMHKTSISSNNVPVWRIYNHLGYTVDNMTYVFVKHTK